MSDCLSEYGQHGIGRINKVVDWYSLCSDAARHGADRYLGEADLRGKLFVSRCRQVWAPRCLILPRLYSLNSGAGQVGGRLSSDTRRVKCPIGRNGQINSVSSIYLSHKAICWEQTQLSCGILLYCINKFKTFMEINFGKLFTNNKSTIF